MTALADGFCDNGVGLYESVLLVPRSPSLAGPVHNYRPTPTEPDSRDRARHLIGLL